MERITSCAHYSTKALEFALAICPLIESKYLWARLYRFNSTPISKELTKYWADRNEYLSEMHSLMTIHTPELLSQAWKRQSYIDKHWLYFRRTSGISGCRNEARKTYKIYVSPRLKEFNVTLPRVIKIALEHDCTLLKFPSNPYEVVRPDKIILYAQNRDHVFQMMKALTKALKGVAAQGVPFAADHDGTGLISWAVDPDSTSWRVWICKSIAKIILDMDKFDTQRSVEYAKELITMRLNIDTEMWILNKM